MRQILATVGPVLVVLLVLWMTVRRVRSRRRAEDLQPPVSPRWLNENIYRKDGDQP